MNNDLKYNFRAVNLNMIIFIISARYFYLVVTCVKGFSINDNDIIKGSVEFEMDFLIPFTRRLSGN